MSNNIVFIGAGNMASAIIGGLIAKGHAANTITACDPFPAALETLQQKFGVHTSHDNSSAIKQADVVVLAVKPQVMKQVLAPLEEAFAQAKPLIISIAAGINLQSLSAWTDAQAAIVRSMPNTPALVQTGATASFANAYVTPQQKNQAETLLAAFGFHCWVQKETELDAVTAVSGSGPAYFFLIMEAMIEAGEALGLDKTLATELTLQTALGAAKMAQSSDVEPAELRRRVTSPAGTTEAALKVLEAAEIRDIFKQALSAADARAVSLAQELGE